MKRNRYIRYYESSSKIYITLFWNIKKQSWDTSLSNDCLSSWFRIVFKQYDLAGSKLNSVLLGYDIICLQIKKITK